MIKTGKKNSIVTIAMPLVTRAAGLILLTLHLPPKTLMIGRMADDMNPIPSIQENVMAGQNVPTTDHQLVFDRVK